MQCDAIMVDKGFDIADKLLQTQDEVEHLRFFRIKWGLGKMMSLKHRQLDSTEYMCKEQFAKCE